MIKSDYVKNNSGFFLLFTTAAIGPKVY